ncbi:MAG: peptidoglycan DD-metalloendopeptidase family protein [Defluviitaleaceae bacterium]|nr:peptidoglycan DD-metalloendopeptidase family protein [Defluviitaleaceae bacterium]
MKKVSELIKNNSHKQKKYISLMLVPSYSTGKTRSLRIPRAVLYVAAVFIFSVFTVIAGFYLRSLYYENSAKNLSSTLEEVQETFQTFQHEAEAAQSELIDATTQMYEQLSEEQMRAQMEIYRQERRHQDALEDIWEIIDELEDQIREFEEVQQEIVSGLSSRRIIPPVANLLSHMEETQKELRDSLRVTFSCEKDILRDENCERMCENSTRQEFFSPLSCANFSRNIKLSEIPETVPVASVGFLSYNAAPAPADELFLRLGVLRNELEIQRLLLKSIEEFKEKVEPYLSNYPTIWPVNGKISSGFGWRRNPFGRGKNEFHYGVDIPAKNGTSVRAAGGGVVSFEGWRNGYGNTVEIDHGGGIKTLYAHNTRNNVSEGQRVERGDIIANVGSTGRSTGSHLHYEVLRNGTSINPVSFLLEKF